jgi:hypothetical protein
MTTLSVLVQVLVGCLCLEIVLFIFGSHWSAESNLAILSDDFYIMGVERLLSSLIAFRIFCVISKSEAFIFC